MNRPTVCIVFGETVCSYTSSTGGVIDRFSYSWPFLLEQRLNQRGRPAIVRNSLLSREPIRQAAERLERDCLDLRPDVVLLHFGQTDALLTDAETPVTPLNRFRRDLEGIITRIRRSGARPVLLTPPPLTVSFPEYMMRAAYQYGANGSLARYAQAIRAIAVRRKIPLLDLFALFPQQPLWEEMLFSGCCPNRAGSRFAAEKLARFLPPVLKQRTAGARPEKLITIVAHGDSVTNSLGAPGVTSHAFTWRRILEQRLRKAGYPVYVRNSGIPCDRTVNAAARFHADVLARKPDFVLICFGLNDAWITNAQKPVIAARLYREKLGEMVRLAKAKGVVPILVAPNPMTWLYYTNYFQRPVYKQRGVNCRVAELVYEMERVAQAERVGFINLFQIFQDHPQWRAGRNPLVADGLHPSPAGNRLWAGVLADYLQKKMS